MPNDNSYIFNLKKDINWTKKYYLKSLLDKTEQQKFLEDILKNIRPNRVADIACGAGAGSFHLKKIFPTTAFDLVDLNEDAIKLVEQHIVSEKLTGFRFKVGSIYEIPLERERYDLVICLQTLSWIERPKDAICELMRICSPGGLIICSSLFNLDHDVDLLTTVYDHTRPDGGTQMLYNTLSYFTINKWLDKFHCEFNILPFQINVDLPSESKGVGTYTRKLADGKRQQISAGYLMNWGFLVIKKAENNF